MATSKYEIIQQAKKEWEAAKLKGNAAGMAEAHLKADQARNYNTITKVDAGGNYYQAPALIGGTLKPSTAPKPLSKTQSFQSVLDEYNTSLPGIGNQVTKTLTPVRKQEIAQGTQKFFEKAPVQAGFMQGVSLSNPVRTLERKLDADIDTTQAEKSKLYQAGQIGGIAAQFAVPYAGASKGITALTAKALPNIPKLGQRIAGSVATDLAAGLPLNVNYALNKEGLTGADAAKNIALNTGIDVATGGLIEGIPAIAKLLRKTPALEAPQNIPGSVSEATPKMPVQTSTAPVQPRNQNLGTEIPKEQTFSEIDGLKKDLGADVNKFNAGQKVSKVKSNTFKNSEMFAAAEKDMLSDKDYMYDVVSEKQSLAEAKQRLEADFDGEVADLQNKANFDGVDMDTSMGILETYLKEARQTGDYSKVDKWAQNIQQKGTQGGQLIQSFAKYSRTPEGAVVKAKQTVAKVEREIKKKNPALLDKTEKEIDEILKALRRGELPKPTNKKLQNLNIKIRELSDSGQLSDDAIRILIQEKNGIPNLTNDEIKAIVENMELSAKATDPYMKSMYASRAEQIISDKVPAEFREKFRALQRLSLILNPKTLITRNPGGNILLGTAENIKDIPGAAIDKLVSLRTGERTTALAPIAKTTAQAKGLKQGLSEWAKDIKYGVDTSPSRGQFELPSARVFKNPVLNALDQFERKALQLGDRPFYQAAYNSRIAELKKLGKTGEEAELDARMYALDRVFQNDSELSKRAVQIRRTLGLPGDLLMPFTQTPANILDKLIDYSPAGLGKAIYQLGSTAGKGTFNQKKFVDTLARTFTGAGIAMLTYAMFEKGILSGNLSDNADVRQAEQLQGKQYYSVKIGDTWYSYDWAQPIAGIMAATADAIKAGATKDDFSEALVEGGTTAIDSVFNQSFLSGILTAFSGYSPASGIGAALLGSTSQATPTVGANLAKVIDPVIRETYDPNTFKQQTNKLLARIPFASKTLPAKVDVKGETLMQSQGRGTGARALENFLAPYRVSQETNDPVNAELMRLQSQTGDNAVLLNKTPKSFTKDGTPYIFTTDEYTAYQKTVGQTAYKEIQNLVSTPEYNAMTDDEKAKAVKDIHTAAIEKARVEYFTKKNLPVTLVLTKSQQEKFAAVKDTGITDKVFYKILRTADTDNSGSMSNRELRIAMRNEGLTSKQTQALYRAYNPIKKKD